MGLQSEAKAAWQGSAILVIKKDKIQEFKRAVAKIIAPTRNEPGCITYVGYQVLNEQAKKQIDSNSTRSGPQKKPC